MVGLLLLSTQLPAQTGKNFLWKVEGEGGAVAYLLGSLHVLTPEWYPLSAVINQAFTDSKTLVEEVDLDETNDPMLMMAALSKAMLTDGKTLDQVVAPDVYAEVKRRAEQSGLPMLALQRMKPWLVAITLMAPTLQAAGFKPELGVDRHFFDRAKASGMKRRALETIAYQLDRFDQLSAEAPGRSIEDDDGGSGYGGDGRERDGAVVVVWERRRDGEIDARRAEGSSRALHPAAG